MKQNEEPTPPLIRQPQREIEALVGGALLKVGGAVERRAMTKSKLVHKEVYLPKCEYTMHYHEREAISTDEDTTSKNQPTILFFHGFTQKSQDFAAFIASLDIDPSIRILCPEQMGHGRDIERARHDPTYEHPTHECMLQSTSEFLDVVQAGSNCNAFGISLGGAVCYYLANHRPDVIKRSVLVSPAIVPCVDKDLLRGLQDGTNNFACFESREDVKLLMRDLSTGRDDNDRKKKDPVPKFLLEAIYRASKQAAPEGHNRALLLNLLHNTGLTHSAISAREVSNANNPFSAVRDVDKESHRLVIWPEKDRIISYEQGKQFFEVSETKDGDLNSRSANTEFEVLPDCGHVFHSDGRMIFDLIRPRVREYLINFSDC